VKIGLAATFAVLGAGNPAVKIKNGNRSALSGLPSLVPRPSVNAEGGSGEYSTKIFEHRGISAVKI